MYTNPGPDMLQSQWVMGVSRHLITITITILFFLVILLLLFCLLHKSREEVIVAQRLLGERLQASVFLLPLAVLVDGRFGKTGNVPELDKLVMAAADEEARVPGLANLFNGFTDVLANAADDPVGEEVHSSDGNDKRAALAQLDTTTDTFL